MFLVNFMKICFVLEYILVISIVQPTHRHPPADAPLIILNAPAHAPIAPMLTASAPLLIYKDTRNALKGTTQPAPGMP